MDKIYEQAKDLHVVATYIYINNDGFAYKDEKYTKKFKSLELLEVFVKGALINSLGVMAAKPVTLEFGEDGIFTIYYMTKSGELGSLKSEADE